MKKSLFALSIAALVFTSCKKEETGSGFTPTDMTGEAHIRGNVSRNVIAPITGGSYNPNARIPVQGVVVTARIAKNALYPNSNAQGSDVYSAVSDVNGNYDITVKANGNGVAANIIIEGFSGNYDTLVTNNGVTTVKKGQPCLYLGTNAVSNVFKGQSSWYSYQFNATNIGGFPSSFNTGLATVTGSVGMTIVRQNVTVQLVGGGTPANGTVNTTTVVPVNAGAKIYMNFDIDPVSLAMKQYTTTTDGAARYTFNVNTVAMGTAGFSQNGTIWVPDMTATRDTFRVVSTYSNNVLQGTPTTTMILGPSGVYNGVTTSQTGLYNTELRNAVNVTYTGFTPN